MMTKLKCLRRTRHRINPESLPSKEAFTFLKTLSFPVSLPSISYAFTHTCFESQGI